MLTFGLVEVTPSVEDNSVFFPQYSAHGKKNEKGWKSCEVFVLNGTLDT